MRLPCLPTGRYRIQGTIAQHVLFRFASSAACHRVAEETKHTSDYLLRYSRHRPPSNNTLQRRISHLSQHESRDFIRRPITHHNRGKQKQFKPFRHKTKPRQSPPPQQMQKAKDTLKNAMSPQHKKQRGRKDKNHTQRKTQAHQIRKRPIRRHQKHVQAGKKQPKEGKRGERPKRRTLPRIDSLETAHSQPQNGTHNVNEKITSQQVIGNHRAHSFPLTGFDCTVCAP